ncbi:Endoplasmic reticulum transmembrane protein 3 [Rhodotorula kratochvilovae]
MAIQNQICFGILCGELLAFLFLSFPLPFSLRRKVFKTIAESHIVAKAMYGLKITFIFIAVLFADAVNQMLKIHREREALSAAVGGAAPAPDMRVQSDYRSRKFLSERNFYLHGSCLIFSLILSRTYTLVLDLIKAQEELAIVKAQTGTGTAVDEKLANPDDRIGNTDKKKVKTTVVDKNTDKKLE